MHIVWTIFDAQATGAIQTGTHQQMAYLAAQGWRVTVLSNTPPPALTGVNYIHIPWCKKRGLIEHLQKLFSHLPTSIKNRYGWYNALLQRQLPWTAARHIANQLNPDDIDLCACNQAAFSPALAWLRNTAGIPYITALHGDIFSHPPDAFSQPLMRLYRQATRHAAQHSNHITVVGHALLDRAMQLGARSNKLSYLPNGIDPADIGLNHTAHIQPTPNRLLYVGRLNAEKGVDVLLTALAKLTNLAADLNPELDIIGDGPQREKLQAQALKLGITERVHFHGVRPRTQLGTAYRSASVVVIPSRTEAQGVVVLEAMLSGAAIIASRTGGIVDMLVDQHNGVLVPPTDADALATALQQLLTQTDYRNQLAQQAQCSAQAFTWPPLLAQFGQLAQQIADQTARTSRA